jgi:hypothetical protein
MTKQRRAIFSSTGLILTTPFIVIVCGAGLAETAKLTLDEEINSLVDYRLAWWAGYALCAALFLRYDSRRARALPEQRWGGVGEMWRATLHAAARALEDGAYILVASGFLLAGVGKVLGLLALGVYYLELAAIGIFFIVSVILNVRWRVATRLP